MFKCYICGKEYETPTEAAICTLNCNKKQEATEEAKRKELLKVLNDTITQQYEGLKNNVNKYNELGPDYELRCTLSTVTKEPKVKKEPNTEPNAEYLAIKDFYKSAIMDFLLHGYDEE